MGYVIGFIVFGLVMLIGGIVSFSESATVGIIGIVVGIVALLVVIIPLAYGIKRRKKNQEELWKIEVEKYKIQQKIEAEQKAKKAEQEAEKYEMKVKELEKEEEFNSWLIQQGFVISSTTTEFLIDTTNKKWCKKFDDKIFDFSDIMSASINKHRSSSSSANYRYDTSSYEVLIKTNDINTPLLTINCYRDKAAAEKICATIDIMCGKKKRISKGTEYNGE